MAEKLIIWDCDGVLVDSEWIGAKAFTEIINNLGGNLTVAEVYQELKGGDIYKSIEYVKKNADIPSDADIVSMYRKRSGELFEQELSQVEGVEEVLKTTSRYRCVASNGPRIKIFDNLRITGLMQYFDTHSIFSGHDLLKFKPDPGLFLMAAEKMGAHPQDCIVIEDSGHGAEAAQAAGMICYGFCAATPSEHFEAFGAIPFTEMKELLKVIKF